MSLVIGVVAMSTAAVAFLLGVVALAVLVRPLSDPSAELAWPSRTR